MAAAVAEAGHRLRQPLVNRVWLRMGLQIGGCWCDRGGGRSHYTDLVWQGVRPVRV